MMTEKICAAAGCENIMMAKGYCRAHYRRMRKTGSALTPTRRRSKSSEVRSFFHEKIHEYDGEECLIWPFARTSDGYAIMRLGERCGIVSRFVCEKYNGPPRQKNLQAAHSCGNGHIGCVNRKHLSWKTPMENTRDRLMFGRSFVGTGVGRAKLTPFEVSEIRKLRGVHTQAEIAIRFGVTQSTISFIFSGRTWNDQNYAARLRRQEARQAVEAHRGGTDRMG